MNSKKSESFLKRRTKIVISVVVVEVKKMLKKLVFFSGFLYKKKAFLTVFNTFLSLNTLPQITTDSYTDIEEVCKMHPNALIVIDLLDIGIEYKNPRMHAENKKLHNEILKAELQAGYRIRSYIKSLEEEGFVEIPEFLQWYQDLSKRSILLITDKMYYVPLTFFSSINLGYDSYKSGVLFYNEKFLLQLIEDLCQRYDVVIFISSNKNRLKKVMRFSTNILSVLFVRKRAALDKKDLFIIAN